MPKKREKEKKALQFLIAGNYCSINNSVIIEMGGIMLTVNVLG